MLGKEQLAELREQALGLDAAVNVALVEIRAARAERGFAPRRQPERVEAVPEVPAPSAQPEPSPALEPEPPRAAPTRQVVVTGADGVSRLVQR